MANGMYVHSGAIATDPRFIPMGTNVQDSNGNIYIASDTGGDIKGARIDVWMPSCGAAMQFGRRVMTLRIPRV